MALMKWKVIATGLLVLAMLYYMGSIVLGSLGMDIHWRTFL